MSELVKSKIREVSVEQYDRNPGEVWRQARLEGRVAVMRDGRRVAVLNVPRDELPSSKR